MYQAINNQSPNPGCIYFCIHYTEYFTIFQCETPTPHTPPCCLKVLSHGQKNVIKYYIFNLQWP